jgi:predicted GIY-YIG superfamily endonuclease
MFYVYLLQLNDQRIYVGHTHDLETRLKEHRTGKGAKTTTDTGYSELIHLETFPTRREAVARERQLKGWSRAKKLALARQDFATLKALASSHA